MCDSKLMQRTVFAGYIPSYDISYTKNVDSSLELVDWYLSYYIRSMCIA